MTAVAPALKPTRPRAAARSTHQPWRVPKNLSTWTDVKLIVEAMKKHAENDKVVLGGCRALRFQRQRPRRRQPLDAPGGSGAEKLWWR